MKTFFPIFIGISVPLFLTIFTEILHTDVSTTSFVIIFIFCLFLAKFESNYEENEETATSNVEFEEIIKSSGIYKEERMETFTRTIVPVEKNTIEQESTTINLLSKEDQVLWDKVSQDFTTLQKKWINEDLKVRFLKGSAFIENQRKREAYLVNRLEKTCEFRENMNLNLILTERLPYCEDFRDDCWKMEIFGNDFEGNPIVLVKLAEHRYKNLNTSLYKQDVLKYMTYHQEALLRIVRSRSAFSKNTVQPPYTAIFDLKGLSFTLFREAYGCGFFKDIAELWSINYPETIRRIYLINSPTVLKLMMTIVSPFIEPDTLEKIKVTGSNYLQTFQNDKIPMSSIPKQLGGQCEGHYILPLNENIK